MYYGDSTWIYVCLVTQGIRNKIEGSRLMLVEMAKAIKRNIQYQFKYGFRISLLHLLKKRVYICAESAVHGNMGDQALSFCRIEFLKSLGIKQWSLVEYTSRDRMRYWSQICNQHKMDDVLILRGGGFWGNLWIDGFDAILTYIDQFHNNRIIVFPQSVFFSDDEIGMQYIMKSRMIINNAPWLTIAARDKSSQKKLKELYPKTEILCTPDTVLSYKPCIKTTKLEGVLLCMRTGKEKKVDANVEIEIVNSLKRKKIPFFVQNTSIDFCLWNIKERNRELLKIWKKFAAANLVITDRLHGMIFATITGTPCIAFDNIDGKIGHQFEWIRNLGYIKFVSEKENMDQLIDQLYMMGKQDYPLDIIESEFESLKKVFYIDEECIND